MKGDEVVLFALTMGCTGATFNPGLGWQWSKVRVHPGLEKESWLGRKNTIRYYLRVSKRSKSLKDLENQMLLCFHVSKTRPESLKTFHFSVSKAKGLPGTSGSRL
jgi:hypothetical protein